MTQAPVESSTRSREVVIGIDIRGFFESFSAQIDVNTALQEWIDNALDAALCDFGTQGRVSVLIKIDRKNRLLEVTNWGGQAMTVAQMEDFLQFASRSQKGPKAHGQHHLGGTASLLACTHRQHGHLYVEAQDEQDNQLRSVQIDHLWNRLRVGEHFPITTTTTTPNHHSHTTFVVDGVDLAFFNPDQLAKACDSLGWTYSKLLQEGHLSIKICYVGNGKPFEHTISPAFTFPKDILLEEQLKIDGFDVTVSAVLADPDLMKQQAVKRAQEYGHDSQTAFRHYTSALIYFNGRLTQIIPLKDLPLGITRKGTLDALTVSVHIAPNPRLHLKRNILKTGLHSSDATTRAILSRVTELIKPVVSQLLRDEHKDDELTAKHADSLERTLEKAYEALKKLLGDDRKSIQALLGISPCVRIETYSQANAVAPKPDRFSRSRRANDSRQQKLAGLQTIGVPRVISLEMDIDGDALTVSEVECEGLPPIRISRLGAHKPSVIIDRQHTATIEGQGFVDSIYSYAIILNADSPVIKRILDAFGVNPAVNTARTWLIEIIMTQLLVEVESAREDKLTLQIYSQIKTMVDEIIANLD